MKNDLLYLHEHLSCNHYVSDYRCCFKYYETETDAALEALDQQYNQLLFLIKGEMLVCCNEFRDRTFRTGEIAFLPKGADIMFRFSSSCHLLACTFDLPNSPCDKLVLQSFWQLCREMEYDFRPIAIRPQLTEFINLLAYYLQNGINCEHLHEIKQKELFLLFKWFYPREELARLFYPMIGKSLDFKALVMENYTKANSVEELARMTGMGRSNFDAKFKDIFGIPPHQWMLKQKGRHVLHALSQPEVTLSDIIAQFDFSSPSQFTRFCRQQFNMTPTEIQDRMRDKALA